MVRFRLALLAGLGVALLALPAVSQQPPPAPKPPSTLAPKSRTAPRLVPVAETKLLMDGLTQPNFQGLERILKQKEIDTESWTFARGQALLISETGNLLMMRPPKSNVGTDVWMKAGMELRDAAAEVARTAATRDRERTRASLVNLATACNGCHQTFRIPTKITAFAEPQPGKP